jgi:hypothetical protein
MKLVRATKDLKFGTDQIKKGCLGVVNGHLTFHAALIAPAAMGPVYEDIIVFPQDGFEDIEFPGDEKTAMKIAEHLRWSLDAADPFTNEIASLMKDVLRGGPRAVEFMTERLTEMS